MGCVFSSVYLAGDAELLPPKSEFDELLFSPRKLKVASGFLGSTYENKLPLGFLSPPNKLPFDSGISFFDFFIIGSLKRLSSPDVATLAIGLISPG